MEQMKKKAVVYIHGKGGNIAEAEHYRPLFPDREVLALDYKAENPWEAKEEFSAYFSEIAQRYDSVSIVANSIGAFFLMNAVVGSRIEEAWFISPIVDMEKLITNMMMWAGVTEEMLREEGEIPTAFGETLSWEYLCYVREHPTQWIVPTHILYGAQDNMTDSVTMAAFAERMGAELTVMSNGEHWFHTAEQMAFLDSWIEKRR